MPLRIGECNQISKRIETKTFRATGRIRDGRATPQRVSGVVRDSSACIRGAGGKRSVAGKCELRGQEQFSVELPRIRAGSLGQTQSAADV